MPHSRRTFLKSAGIATAAISAAPLALGLPGGPGEGPSTAAAAPGARGFAAGHFALELDGASVGIVQAFQGGNAYADVLEFTDGGDLITRKQPGQLHYEPITVLVGLGMEAAFWEWIEAMFVGRYARKDGSIVIADGNFNVLRRMDFTDALVTEVTFPALDASSKDAGRVMVTFQPRMTALRAGSGKLVDPSPAKQKAWLVSNFRISIGNLPCNRVNKVEALTFKQKVVEENKGNERTPPTFIPDGVESPNVDVTFAAVDVSPWQAFFDDFVLAGNNDEDHELSGRIEYLSSNLQTVLAHLQFFNLGIVRLAPEGVDPNSTSLSRFEATLYSEGMQFTVGGTT